MLSISMKRSAALVATGVAFLSLAASSARADFGFTPNTGAAVSGSDGQFTRQAGAHADLDVHFEFNRRLAADGTTPIPDDNARDVTVDLPPGSVGNPTAAPTCSYDDLLPSWTDLAQCPVAAQIGIAHISETSAYSPPYDVNVAIYNMPQPADAPGLFAFNYAGAAVKIKPRLRPGDYGISADTTGITQAIPPFRADIVLWGVPADPSHDAERMNPAFGFGSPSPDRRKAFLTTPTSCSGQPSVFTISADSWQNPGKFVSTSFSQDANGIPFTNTGCDKLPFDPSIDVKPLSRSADAPTGLDFGLDVPQNDNPDGLATAHVKSVKLTLPQGMSVSPSSAAGLGACAEDQIKLGSNDDPTCPDSAKLGTVTIDTPLLSTPLTGDVILAQPDNNPFRTLLALYLVARGPGVTIKLPGKIEADPVTGQLTTTFDNNPQLPFSHLDVRFRGGSQAPLATPAVCGNYSTHADITSWASNVPVSLNSSMTIDQNCGSRDFAPTLSAGSVTPIAGGSSPFSLTLTRADGQQGIGAINATLPSGLLAHIADVPQCAAGAAAAGTCGAESLVGSTSVLSGPGSAPLALTGRVYLTGPYNGAPFGLSIVVPTAGQAGPYDLGNVVVRAGIFVDRTDAHVTVKSDPLPTILRGIPLRLRQVNVTMDRPDFMINPTSCGSSSVSVFAASIEGATRALSVPFQVAGCRGLDMNQRLAIKFTGKTQLTDGKHPGVDATLTAPTDTANLRKVTVKLPLSVALDPDNAEALCSTAQRAALSCPAKSIVGYASARSVLPHVLTAPVYFVKGERRSPSGRIIPTLPKLWIPLSADGVTIDVNADSDVDSINRLVTTFDNLPDAPISNFRLVITGGSHGILVVSGHPGTCDRDKGVDSEFVGQNGKVVQSRTEVKVDGCKPKVAKTTVSSKAVTLRITGLGAGRLSAGGKGLVKASRTLKAATAASITTSLSAKTRAALKRHRSVRVAVVVKFAPKSGKASTMRRMVTLRH